MYTYIYIYIQYKEQDDQKAEPAKPHVDKLSYNCMYCLYYKIILILYINNKLLKLEIILYYNVYNMIKICYCVIALSVYHIVISLSLLYYYIH